MNDQEWVIITGLIDEWWPGKFEPSTENAWFVALEGFDAGEVTIGLKALLGRGGTFRPSVAEVVAEIRRDPSTPTFPEALVLIRSVLATRTTVRKGSWEDGERDRLDRDAMLERAAEVHPLVAAFIQREGLDRLRSLNLADEQFGEARRRALQVSWDAHCDAMDGRDVAALAAGRRGEMGHLDPLAALKALPDIQRQLPAAA